MEFIAYKMLYLSIESANAGIFQHSPKPRAYLLIIVINFTAIVTKNFEKVNEPVNIEFLRRSQQQVRGKILPVHSS